MTRPDRLYDEADLAIIEVNSFNMTTAIGKLIGRLVNELRWYREECERLQGIAGFAEVDEGDW